MQQGWQGLSRRGDAALNQQPSPQLLCSRSGSQGRHACLGGGGQPHAPSRNVLCADLPSFLPTIGPPCLGGRSAASRRSGGPAQESGNGMGVADEEFCQTIHCDSRQSLGIIQALKNVLAVANLTPCALRWRWRLPGPPLGLGRHPRPQQARRIWARAPLLGTHPPSLPAPWLRIYCARPAPLPSVSWTGPRAPQVLQGPGQLH